MKSAAAELVERYGVDTVVEILGPLLSEERKARIEEVLSARLASLTIAVENLYDPHNGAAAIRSVEALGLSQMHVIEEITPFRFAKAVTRRCDKWIDVHRHRTLVGGIEALRAAGFRLLATVPGASADIDTVAVDGPVAVLFGNEHDGLSPAAVAACDQTVAIPMFGFTQSFNLSVSVATVARTLAARRRAHIGTPGDLPGPERARLRARWYALGVRGSGAILRRHVSGRTQHDVG